MPALERILPGGPERARVEREMREVRDLLGGGEAPGRLRAGERAAAAVLRTIDTAQSSPDGEQR